MQNMLGLYKRSWKVFFPVSAILVIGMVQTLFYLGGQPYENLVLSLLGFLASATLIVGIIAYVYDRIDAGRIDARRKEKWKKRD